MPASGSATTTRLVRLVPLTGLPAQADLLTATTNTIVATQTSRFDNRCDTPALLRAIDYRLALTLERLGCIEGECQRRLVVVAIEGSRLQRIDANEVAVLHLHPDQT